MHENILSGRYNDPFEFDIFQESSLENYEDNLKALFTEKRKRRGTTTRDTDCTIDDSRYEDPSKRSGFRRVELNVPWTGDQSLYWPNYEAEAFEKALEDFKQPANDGYDCKALLDRIKDRWGTEYLKKTLAKQKPLKKESARTRFLRKLNESRQKDELEEECVSAEFQRMAPANVIGVNIQGRPLKKGKKDKYNKLGLPETPQDY